jgi:uncharacterized protein
MARAMSSSLPSLVTALLAPGAYPFPVERVELVETHISWVLLAGERVYKIKKPVDLGFLDFTTLERRRFFCEEEVRLNRRLAPDAYLGTVELTGSPAHPRFGGGGAVLEVAVEMRRLPAGRMLDRLVEAHAVTPGLMEDIGHTVARFHLEAATGGEIDALGGIDTVRRNWEENFLQTRDLGPRLLPEDWRRTLSVYVESYLEREAPRFAARVAGGHSRDCHGDLQAQHVCCTEPIQIFDCIEFNHRFRFGDTAGEIAFLAMDLDRLGRPDLAIRFVNAYLEASGDWGAVPLLDFYRAYRAFVRAKVLSFQVTARPAIEAEARARFRLALDYARPPQRLPRLVVTTGVMGAGKSTVARAVAERIGAIVIRTDVVRKRLAGLSLDERAAHGFGEGLYAPAMGEQTYAEALRLAADMLAAGWPVVVDGSFSHARERDEARALAGRMGVPHVALRCQAPREIIADRLRRRARDRHEVSDGRVELLAQHLSQYEADDGPDVLGIDTTKPIDAELERGGALLPPLHHA